MTEDEFKKLRKEVQGKYFKKIYKDSNYYRHIIKLEYHAIPGNVRVIYNSICKTQEVVNFSWTIRSPLYFLAIFGDRIKPIEYKKMLKKVESGFLKYDK